MAGIRKTDDRAWLADQVAEYTRVYADYQRYAALLEEIFQRAAREIAPLAMVQARAKSIASFADKVWRKRDKYDDPVHELTDLCGARVIARTRSEVESICTFVKQNFDIDWANSLDCSQRLKPTEFGYRSIHYIVSVRPDREEEYGEPLPAVVLGKKAEVQVRTVVEHAYADFGHDVTYKGAFELPLAWQRELAAVAAAFEEADETFARIEGRMRTYATSYGAFLGPEALQLEIAKLQIVLEHDRDNDEVAARLGKLAITAGEWQRAIGVLERFVDPERPGAANPLVLRELGVALCKANRNDPRGVEYRRGQHYLEIASGVEAGPGTGRGSRRRADVDALCSLAGSWKGIDEARVSEYYRRAFEADPHDTYALGNYLEQELQHNAGVLAAARPLMQAAIERCQAQADARVNLPWAFYDMAKFHLLLDEPDKSLDALSKALAASTADFMIETSLRSVERLEPVKANLRGYEWARRLLLLGLAARFPTPSRQESVRRLATAGATAIEGPVVIVGGGTDPRVETQMRGYGALLLEALTGFKGTIISGGTKEGVSGLVGDAAEAYPGRIRTIGYLPQLIPQYATKDTDRSRYNELRYTDGHGFSPLEPLQNWIDLFASGVSPDDVRVVGIGGGPMAAVEYRIALALGARVGLVARSGREAERIFIDPHWAASEVLLSLPPDPQAVRAFLGWEPLKISEDARETIAKAIHEDYRRSQVEKQRTSDPAMADWDRLHDDLKESNRDQARHLLEKLRQIGCSLQRLEEARGKPEQFSADEIELLARMEHGRYVAERLLKGWRYGEKRDVERKTHPSLVGWDELPESEKEKDRESVRNIPALLATVGLALRRDR